MCSTGDSYQGKLFNLARLPDITWHKNTLRELDIFEIIWLTEEGYDLNGTVRIEYDIDHNECVIVNGSFIKKLILQ